MFVNNAVCQIKKSDIPEMKLLKSLKTRGSKTRKRQRGVFKIYLCYFTI